MQAALTAWAAQAPLRLPLRSSGPVQSLRQAHVALCEAVVQGLLDQVDKLVGAWNLSPLRSQLLGLGDEALAALMATLSQPALAPWPVSALTEGDSAARAAWERCLDMARDALQVPSTVRFVSEGIVQAEDGVLLALVLAVWRGEAALVLPIPVPEPASEREVTDLVRRVSQLVLRWAQEPERPAALRAVRVQWALTPAQAASPVWPARLAKVGHHVLSERLTGVLERLPGLRDAALAASGAGADEGYDALIGRLRELLQAIQGHIAGTLAGDGAYALALSDLPASPLLAAFQRHWAEVGGQWGEGLPEAPGPVSVNVSWPAPAAAAA